ncbi:hypothetical protein EAF00_000142 [Botryotinia globosa]|nr:hypothetical protein EAF00_000142 [Botryotinia globosa]
MPRNRVDPLRRRRVAQACDSCKRRKEKRSGGTPAGSANPDIEKRPARGSSNHSASVDHHAMCELDDLALSETLKEDDNTVLNAAPKPKVSRMLRDSKGSFIYVGESASLSFLQTVRRAVIVAVGPCESTSDPLRHLMIETTPAVRFDNVNEPLLDLAEALSLADHFFQVVSGIMDLFDAAWLIDKLQTWVEDSPRREKLESPVIYLALAIGAQGRARDESDEIIAERCFGYSRQIATFTLIDDPSLLTAQLFILITYYMLAECRHNGAFANLGVTVRAAYALRNHRHETNLAFVPQEGISRERTWKTLRVCDLFLGASMGRPPATSDTNCNIPWTSVDQVASRESKGEASYSFNAEFNTYADACVDSAIKGIDVAHETVYEQAMPQHQPFIISSVFISVLCLELAYLDDFDRRGWPLSTGLRRGIAILNHFGRLNPQSARYSKIYQLLHDATTIYVNDR